MRRPRPEPSPRAQRWIRILGVVATLELAGLAVVIYLTSHELRLAAMLVMIALFLLFATQSSDDMSEIPVSPRFRQLADPRTALTPEDLKPPANEPAPISRDRQ